MDIYTRKSYWKWYLAAGGVLIIIISLLYTRYLADRLVEREKQQAEQFAEAMRMLAKMRTDTLANYYDLTLHLKIIEQNTTIPVIVLNESGDIEQYRNIDDRNLEEMEMAEVEKAYTRMVQQDTGVIEMVFPPDIHKTMIYTHSSLLKWLNLYPYLQLALIATFIVFGYLGFSAARRAEQNQVWLGMAKETAHQLRTPLSSLMAWVEVLREDPDIKNKGIVDELDKDVRKLRVVTERFSSIGSTPVLKDENVYQLVNNVVGYLQPRVSSKINFEVYTLSESIMARVHAPLFEWVVENLCKNAVDAMGSSGTIAIKILRGSDYKVFIDISDTGKGIPKTMVPNVFRPGFTTKKRGWGLGLALAQRIIEMYHEGKIFVKSSEENMGTTFRIELMSS
ncbi:MAG TPA: HAMP domain-containing sensor histidine kinase [Cyclobacteriaceae bacterium]|nr:HAMP domain-containing sensor histidine kinase [Cyclobacteriaceae bacterium]